MVQFNRNRDNQATSPSRTDGGIPWYLRLDFVTRQPTWNPFWSVAIILALIGLVAVLDIITGPHVSMRVFYDIPVILAVVWLGGRASAATCAICMFSLYAVGIREHAEFVKTPQVYWNLPVGFALYLVVAWILQAFVLLRRELEQRVRQRTMALEQSMLVRAELQREVLFASERERAAIGQDLHDGLCQHLVGTAFAAQVLAEKLAARGELENEQAARQIVGLVEEGVRQTRQLAHGLLLNAIRPERLAAELEEYARAVSRQNQVRCDFVALGPPGGADEQSASHLFRIAQESVRNALRHARPKSIQILLKNDTHHLTLMVSDDGVGLDHSLRQNGMGLRIMRNRAKIIEGELTIECGAEGGTSVRCHVPVCVPVA